MAPLSLKIVQGGGAITRKVLFDTTTRVSEALEIVKEKVHVDDPSKEYGLFLTSADDELSGVWLEGHRTLDYYMLRDGDSLQYLCRTRNLRVRMLDGSEKTMQIDESKCVGDLMMVICDRIGITNHDEYGLCFEDEAEPPQDEKPATGTLTLKKKQQTREKDAKLEQLSKKLKTDDNVEWLAQQKTLREMGVDPKKTLLLKRRLFYSDRNVDSRDPVQLNLLYVQTRDAILDGRQVLTEEKAVEFAGIQCQVQYGDYQEDKHKPGFIENLKEFLPEQYASSWGIERKVLREHGKHHGLNPLEAKHLYTRNARELPTYGVTFFLVKEQQKGKKKLVPRLLGINAESILRLDEVTKEILQVWMLTQVKTFRAGKETFTLDFGDYSDKEYTVKTNEAHRIRDILQGYIDIIHRSLAAPFNIIPDEGQAICEDNVSSSRGHIIQNIVPMKLVEHSFVGPSKLVPYVQGSEASQGTQIMTVKQMMVTNVGGGQRRGIAGEAGVMRNNSLEYLKKLNRLNTNSVETVAFLTDPNYKQADKVKKVNALATIIEEDMNSIVEGVHRSVENDNEDVRKKLLSELDEMCASFDLLISTSKRNDFGTAQSLDTAQEAAEKIVGHCTQMYCSLDPGIKRRSRILKHSHKSFVADEKTEATLRRASFQLAASRACKAVDNARQELADKDQFWMVGDSVPEGYEVEDLEREARKKIAKISAAVALLMSAQADPNNLDYSAAITSMVTIDELLPELVQDAKTLGGVKSDKFRQSVVGRLGALCDAARSICALTGEEDKEQLQELAYKYAKAADKLVSTFGLAAVPERENEILDLARDVGDKTSMLLMKTHDLTNLVGDHRATELDSAGQRCADGSRILLACAQLTASSIDEPHCQSAMTAAAESLASSVQHLAATWKPLVEEPGRRMFEQGLATNSSELMKALERLKEAYANLPDTNAVKDDDESNRKQRERLKFISSKNSALNDITDAEKELDTPTKSADQNINELQRLLGQRLSSLNAAVASLIRATSDADDSDYNTAEEAVSTIAEVMPHIVRDAKVLSASNKDEKAARAMMKEIQGLCAAAKDLCAESDKDVPQDANESASKFARHSSKLCYMFIPRNDNQKENTIIELSKATCERASELLTHVNQLAEEVGADDGQELDQRGAKLVDVVQALLTSAQITAPSFGDTRCQSAMLAAADEVSSSCKKLADIWTPLVRGADQQSARRNLEKGRSDLETALDNLRTACKNFGDANENLISVAKSKEKERERLKFATTLAAAKDKMSDAAKNIEKPPKGKIREEEANHLEKKLEHHLAQLNAAIASLLRAAADEMDYGAAEQALNTIAQMLPEVINDTQALSTSQDAGKQHQMLSNLRELLDAMRDTCSRMEQGDAQAVNDTALRFAEASGKLRYVFSKQQHAMDENQIIDLSKAACEKASLLLTSVQQLAEMEGGEGGERLDEAGCNVVNAAGTMLVTAQILGPTIVDPNCKSALLASINNVSATAEKLDSVWKPMKNNPNHDKTLMDIERERDELEWALNQLRAACEGIDEENVLVTNEGIKQRSIRSVSREKRALSRELEELVKIDELSKRIYGLATEMAADGRTLVDSKEGEVVDRVEECGEMLIDASQELYSSIANVKQYPGDSSRNYTVLAAIEAVNAASFDLVAACSMVQDVQQQKIMEKLLRKQEDLDAALRAMRAACKDVLIGLKETQYDSDEKTKQWLSFMKIISDSAGDLQQASAEISKPVGHAANITNLPDLQRRTAQELAEMNAAVASLIQTASDRREPDYMTASEATKCITGLMPRVIKDVKLLSITQDETTRKNTMDQLRSLHDAIQNICGGLDSGNVKDTTDAISKYVAASRKLNFEFNPISNPSKGKQTEDLAAAAGAEASRFLCDVYTAAQSEPSQDWSWLGEAGERTANAIQNLLTTAQIVALSPDEEHCKLSLQSAIDELSSSSRALHSGLKRLAVPEQGGWNTKLDSRSGELNTANNALREACGVGRASQEPEEIVPERTSADAHRQIQDKGKLVTSVKAAEQSIIKTEEEIKKIRKDGISDIPSSEAVQVAAQQLEQKLMQANVAASHLIYCNDPEQMDYKLASKSVDNLSELIPTMVQDLKELDSSQSVKGSSVTEDALLLCDATRKLCAAVADDGEKLNEAAVDFADSSARLLYDAGSSVDPEQEKQVISRAKAIGDCASRLVARGASAARAVDAAHAQPLCDAGGACARAASNLLYITKLVAPFIQHPGSQSILLSAAEQLSSGVEQYSSTWQPLSSQPEQSGSFNDLEAECKDLKKLLAELKNDIKNAKLVRRRRREILLVEDSPLRQLTSEILESYKTSVESSELPMEERRAYAQNADKLSSGLKELDVAGAQCRNSPQDVQKLRELEYVTQELQRQVLQSRRRRGAEQSNVVDLMDYVKDVVSNIEHVSKTAQNSGGVYDDKHLQGVREHCCRLSALATKLLQPESRDGEALTEDLRRVDEFAQSCKESLPHLIHSVRNFADVQSRRILENKLQTLNESVNLLRFATQSALATAEGAALDESLHDLTELESNVGKMLNPVVGMNKPHYNKKDNSAVAALCCVAASPHSAAARLTPALATYVTDMRTRTDLHNPKEKHRLEEHLKKLIYLLKTLMITTSRHMVTWQQPDDAEVMSITDQIIQELEDFEGREKSDDKSKPQVIDNVDVRRLLLPPSHVHIDGDEGELVNKYHQVASKLNSSLGTLASSIEHPQTLSRSLQATAHAAIQLRNFAHALGNNQNQIQSHRIEESAKEMCFATFSVLKMGEQVCWEPGSVHTRRRLLDAIRSLNNSINRLTRAVDPHHGVKELVCNLKLQQGLNQTTQPSCALGYQECVEAVQNQSDVIYKLKNDEEISHEECYSTLQYVSTSVCNASEYAAQCAYLISISEKYKDAAKDGLPDVVRIQSLAETMQDTCVKITCAGNNEQIGDLQSVLNGDSQQLQEVVNECKGKFVEQTDEEETLKAAAEINSAVKEFNKILEGPDKTQIGSSSMKILDYLAALQAVVRRPTLLPKAGSKSADTSAASNDVVKHSRELLNKMLALANETNTKTGTRSWAKFEGSSAVIRAFDALVDSIKEGGRRTGLLQSAQAEEEEPDLQKKSNVETQVGLAMDWLRKPSPSEEVKSSGLGGVNKLVEIAKESMQDLNEADREEMHQLIEEVQKLTNECSGKYNKERSSMLLERLQELRKMLQRVVVTRVVEDFLEDDTTFADLELLVDVEKDEKKRKYILEQKIAELLAQIGRVSRTARLAADTSSPRVGGELTQCRQQVELLAPSLVKATEERMKSPHHQALIDKYNALVAQYSESMSKVRSLCDRSVDPVDFVQAASETMQRLREESSAQNDPLKAAHTSNLITRLGLRAVEAGMSSSGARNDPELKRALSGAQRRLESAVPVPGSRASRASKQPDWRAVVAEILRTTGEVESALSGENIFQRQLDPNQPIYAAALDLHAAVREWSARDNEIVAVAKRMAVLMARLSDFMNHDKKREVIATSKAIVKASSEVAALARKLALECTDVRIRTNLLQVCDRIPTISGQLKMLTTVKGSSLGHQDNQEDIEAMNMLVGNAQNLMQSIQEVVNAAAGASVKIMSQRGRGLRWVRKNYNY